MTRKEINKAPGSGMAMVHPNAAAVDIGATMHMAAVAADRTTDPVQCFGTFTGDLHRLADWFAECGVKSVVMESTSVYWIRRVSAKAAIFTFKAWKDGRCCPRIAFRVWLAPGKATRLDVEDALTSRVDKRAKSGDKLSIIIHHKLN